MLKSYYSASFVPDRPFLPLYPVSPSRPCNPLIPASPMAPAIFVTKAKVNTCNFFRLMTKTPKKLQIVNLNRVSKT